MTRQTTDQNRFALTNSTMNFIARTVRAANDNEYDA